VCTLTIAKEPAYIGEKETKWQIKARKRVEKVVLAVMGMAIVLAIVVLRMDFI